MRLFWVKGYSATSMQELVDVMGINRASLYATFGNKHELFVSALRRYDDTFRQPVLRELEAVHPPMVAIRRLFEGWIARTALIDEPRGCLLANTAVEFSQCTGPETQLVLESQLDTQAFFVRLLVNAQQRGELGLEFDSDSCAKSLLATLLGILVLSRSRPEPALLQAVVDQALSVFCVDTSKNSSPAA